MKPSKDYQNCIKVSIVPVQTRSLVELHCADWNVPDEHALEQTDNIINMNSAL